MRLILASASPRRAELLTSAGFQFDVRTADVDERVRSGEDAATYVRRLASEKSAAAFASLSRPAGGHAVPGGGAICDAVVLAADTAVVVDGLILGKPSDRDQARAMLRQLSGRAHEVITGVSLRTRSRELVDLATTRVTFAELGPDEVEWYVASGEGLDKAGAYAIQGLAARFIRRIEGSYSNVVGLPIALVHQMLREVASRG